MRIRIRTIENAGAPVRLGRNDYSCFNCIRNDKGVYIFQYKDTGEVLYVGKTGEGNDRSFKDRIQQHYGRGKSGGNFQINWRKEKCHECRGERACDGNGGCIFREYENLLRNSRIIFLCCEDVQNKSINALENIVKFIFLPKYDDEVMKMKGDEIDVTSLCNVMRHIAINEMESSTIEGCECTEQNPTAALFRNSYVFRLIAANVSPQGILANRPVLRRGELNAAKECLRTRVLCGGDE